MADDQQPDNPYIASPNNNANTNANESPLGNLAIFALSPAYGTFRALAPDTARQGENRVYQSATSMFDTPGRTALSIVSPVGSFVYGLFSGK